MNEVVVIEDNAKLELARLNKVFVGRELRMAEMKEQIRGLEKKAHREAP